MEMVPGFLPLAAAPKSILGEQLLLMHWSGATDVDTLYTVQDAMTAYQNGYRYYKPWPEPSNDQA